VVAYVLRAEEDPVCERFEKDSRRDQSRDGLKPEAAYRAHALRHFTQLRYLFALKVYASRGFEVFGARVCAVRWFKRVAYCAPERVLLFRVRRVGYGRTGLVRKRDLCDAVSSRAVFCVSEAGVVWD
jgi:hypothetical protein